MQPILTTTLIALLLTAIAGPAAAQTPAAPERFWFGIGGGVQPAAHGFTDAFEAPLYTETEKVTIGYPVKGGALIAASGGFRVWKRLVVGIGVTRYNRREDATVAGRIPHPFFDNRPRDVNGTTAVTRSEVGAHLLVGWMMPVTDRFRLLIAAGPSVLSVGQSLVTGVDVVETYPYDTAALRSAIKKNATVSAAGINASADVFWMFSRRVGAGALAQVTHARAKEAAGAGRTVSVDAGGAQISAGLRFVF